MRATWIAVILLCAACSAAAQENRTLQNGQGVGSGIPAVLRQWTAAVKELEKNYDRYAFLNANLSRTFAISGNVPPEGVRDIASAAVDLHRSVLRLEESRQLVDATQVPAQYDGAVRSWKTRIRQIHAGMSREACDFCEIPAESASGAAPGMNSCTDKLGTACGTGPCLDCCEGLADADRQSLCGLMCQFHASLCVLGGIAEAL